MKHRWNELYCDELNNKFYLIENVMDDYEFLNKKINEAEKKAAPHLNNRISLLLDNGGKNIDNDE